MLTQECHQPKPDGRLGQFFLTLLPRGFAQSPCQLLNSLGTREGVTWFWLITKCLGGHFWSPNRGQIILTIPWTLSPRLPPPLRERDASKRLPEALELTEGDPGFRNACGHCLPFVFFAALSGLPAFPWQFYSAGEERQKTDPYFIAVSSRSSHCFQACPYYLINPPNVPSAVLLLFSGWRN